MAFEYTEQAIHLIHRQAQFAGRSFSAMAKPVVGVNDLATTHPGLAKEADGWDPSSIGTASNKKLNWKCPLGHRYEAIVANRSRLGRGCPFCSGRYAVTGSTDLAHLRPDVAAEALGWDPTTVTVSSGRKLEWKCSVGHHWTATINSRTSGGSGCPKCSGRVAVEGTTDLASLFPELAKEADGWDPSTVTAQSGQKMAWRCPKGHEYNAVVANRSKGSGCAVCANKKVLAGFNDLATTDPDLACQAFGWDPTTKLRGTQSKVGWRCKKGHDWIASVANRASNGQGCPYCAGKRSLAGFNDLVTTNPKIAQEADGWDPTTTTAGSNKVSDWKCKHGHTWRMSVNSRTGRGGTQCPYCVGKLIWIGFNDLATTHPDLARQAVGWDPTTVSKGSDKVKSWRCNEGHEWNTAVSNRVGGKGCPTCAPSGYDPKRKGWLYLFRHEGWGLLQVGITNSPKSRFTKHEKAGWVLLDEIGPRSGNTIRKTESKILAALDSRGVRPDTSRSGKFDGYTESWKEVEFPAKSLKELLDLVSESKGSSLLEND